MVHDENHSWYLDDNIRTYLNIEPGPLVEDEDFIESNMMHGKRLGWWRKVFSRSSWSKQKKKRSNVTSTNAV